jgi:hypothetical protein
MSDFDPKQYRYVLSIDIGIHHLGMVLVELNRDYSFHDLIWFDCVNITHFQHLDQESRRTCTLYHTRTVSDWLSHLFYLHSELFDSCEHILLERQPPVGQVAVEQLIFFKFRHKTVLVHPRAVHAHFGWTRLSYEQRKAKSTAMLEFRLDRTPRTWLREEYAKLSRNHDVGDAYAQLHYFIYLQYRRGYTAESTAMTQTLETFRFKLEIEYQ